MRKRGFSQEHEEAVARRLAVLAAEWDAAKTESSRPAAGGTDAGRTDAGRTDAGRTAAGGSGELDVGGIVDDLAEFEWPWEPHTHVRGAVIDADDRPATLPLSPMPTALRPPGRHAFRRAAARGPGLTMPGWGVVGVRLRDRIGLQAAHLTWVAVIAAVALAGTSWWLVRSKEQAVLTPVSVRSVPSSIVGGADGGAGTPAAAPTAAPSGLTPAGGADSETPGPSAQGAVTEVVVDVAGKVRRPGIVVLAQGSRVFDALEAAGGARRGVDLQPLNLARILVDGEQIVVGAPAPTTPAGSAAVPAPDAATGALVNLNTASLTELETLPGVGPVTAAAIVDWRTRHGGFTSVEDLLEVQGIGEVTLGQLAPLVTI